MLVNVYVNVDDSFLIWRLTNVNIWLGWFTRYLICYWIRFVYRLSRRLMWGFTFHKFEILISEKWIGLLVDVVQSWTISIWIEEILGPRHRSMCLWAILPFEFLVWDFLFNEQFGNLFEIEFGFIYNLKSFTWVGYLSLGLLMVVLGTLVGIYIISLGVTLQISFEVFEEQLIGYFRLMASNGFGLLTSLCL